MKFILLFVYSALSYLKQCVFCAKQNFRSRLDGDRADFKGTNFSYSAF